MCLVYRLRPSQNLNTQDRHLLFLAPGSATYPTTTTTTTTSTRPCLASRARTRHHPVSGLQVEQTVQSGGRGGEGRGGVCSHYGYIGRRRHHLALLDHLSPVARRTTGKGSLFPSETPFLIREIFDPTYHVYQPAFLADLLVVSCLVLSCLVYP